jgi:hypothetical protein
VSLLPRKKTPQEWIDVPLPLEGIEAPEPKPVREQSRSDKEKAAGVRWVRHKGRRLPCDRCLAAYRDGAKLESGIGNVVYIRTHGDEKVALCTMHTANQRDADNLGREIQ